MMNREVGAFEAGHGLDSVLRQLLHPDHDRELRVLMKLGQDALRTAEIGSDLGIDHPEKTKRALRTLEKFGLVERFYDKDFAKRGNAFRLSPMGRLAQERVLLVHDFIKSISHVSLAGPTQLTLMPIGQTAGGLTKFSLSIGARESIAEDLTELVRMLEAEAERIHHDEDVMRKRIHTLKARIDAAEQAA